MIHEKSVGDTTEHVSGAQLKAEKARAISRREPISVSVGTPLREGIERMQAANSGVLLVLDGRSVAGLLTEGDVLRRVLADGVDLASPVDDVMTRDPATLPDDATVGEAMALMERGAYRTVPLIGSDGSVTGIVHQREVIEYVAEAFPQEILNLPPRPHQQMEQPEGA